MSSLDRIVNVPITKGTRLPTSKDFGTLMLLSDEGTDLVKTYFTLAEVLEDYAETTQTYRACSIVFASTPTPEKVKVGNMLTATSVANALTAINNSDSAWYYVCYLPDTLPKLEVSAVSTWLISNSKFGVFGSAEADVINETKVVDTDSLLATMNTAKALKMAYIYSSKFRSVTTGEESFGFSDVGFATALSIREAGSFNPAYMELPSGCFVDNLSGNQITNIMSKNGNFYHNVGGLDVTEEGRVPDGNAEGEWIDTIVGIDWLRSTMQETVFGFIASQSALGKKIPYTDNGIAQIESVGRGVMDRGVEREFLNMYETKVTSRANTPVADIASRAYNGLSFQGQLAGAVNTVKIPVNLYY